MVAMVEKTFGRLCQLFLSVRILSSSCSNLSSVSTVKRPLHRRYRPYRRCFCVSLRLINLKSCVGSDGATRFIPSLFFEIIVLRRLLLSCKHRKRARVHSISEGGGTSPVSDLFSPFWVGGGISPPFGLHACTLCMHVFCEDRGVFRDLLAGVFGDCPPDPARNSHFHGAYPAEGESNLI